MTAVLLIAVKVLLFLALIDVVVTLLGVVERRVAGAARGFGAPRGGVLLPIADFLKLLAKENVEPEAVDRPLFVIAPALALAPALLAAAVLPLGGSLPLFGGVDPQIADLDAGLLVAMAMLVLSLLGVVYGSFASNNKYSLLGGLRAVSQLIAYLVVYVFAVAAVVMRSGSLRLDAIVAEQAGGWNVLYQPIGFAIFVIATLAASHRRPFDLSTSGSELVSGYATEYGSLKLALFRATDAVLMLVNASLITLLFLGGWLVPGVSLDGGAASLLQLAVLAVKIALVLFFFLAARWALPRLRHDQLMRMCWKVLVPLAILDLVIAGIVLGL